ncbi:MAG: ATP-dependent DNA helicase RecG [Chloroflexi bacterium]|nr:ATP-dependent DNA helicase RecG [Chloroflexota bacterium]MBP8058166.1 ATP-dependent DNA helicase RecG [Chloroflexota bacterium]
MSRSFKRLEGVLKLETDQGYQDKAVVGGIAQFATYWVTQARQEAVDEADRAFVEQVADVLTNYARLPGKEARANIVGQLREKLIVRAERVGQARPAAQPAPPPRPEKGPRPQSQSGHHPQQQPPKQPPKQPPRPEKGRGDRPPQPPALEKAKPAHRPEPVKEAKKAETPAKSTPPPAREKPAPGGYKPLPKAKADPEGLNQPVSVLRGVGLKLAKILHNRGVTTLLDLLYTFPRRYDDFSLMKPINKAVYGEQVTIIGTVWEIRARRTRTNQIYLQALISDGTGQIQATWFNQPWLAEQLKAGTQIALSGKLEQYLGHSTFNNPEWEPVARDMLRTGRIVPVYPQTEGLNSQKLRTLIKMVLDQWANKVPDPVPADVLQRRQFMPLADALYQIHFPDSQETLHKARQRLIFDELFLLQLGMLGNRQQWQSNPSLPLVADPETLQAFSDSLPFQLTGAQQRVIGELSADMGREVAMSRLLQGDVGAGKTVVAAAAMLLAVKAGAQAALMAPTEILAEQHAKSIGRMLTPFGIESRLLTGSVPASEKENIYRELAEGTAHVAIGTHALIQNNVHFHKLGLAIVDEQHRFGVEQRQALRDKGQTNGQPETPMSAFTPHLLVMSATPIPRSLALSLYGDLEMAILDELPPGRQEIKTRWLSPAERERAYAFVRGQILAGRQAYVICPLVEESDKIEAKSAVDEHARLQGEVFPDFRVGLLHGRMKGEEKEAVMREFYAGNIHILVSTSVIEVGVDVPNSTVMLIEGANRFGLAQLHQFRGRVGRGEHQSYCLLIADSAGPETEERLAALEQTNDGFVLAEKDLQLRGPGEFFGQRQSGLPELQLASLLDMTMLQLARTEADAVLKADVGLQQPEHATLREKVQKFWAEATSVS